MKIVQFVDVNDRIQIYCVININESLFMYKNVKLFLVLLVLSVTELKIECIRILINVYVCSKMINIVKYYQMINLHTASFQNLTLYRVFITLLYFANLSYCLL